MATKTSKPDDTNKFSVVAEFLLERSEWRKSEGGKMVFPNLEGKQTLSCPKCKVPMRAISLGSVEVDECQSCMGVFFDMGEVEQLLHSQKTV